MGTFTFSYFFKKTIWERKLQCFLLLPIAFYIGMLILIPFFSCFAKI